MELSRLSGLTCLVFALFTSPSHALRVTPGSECEAYCLDDSDSNTVSSSNATTSPSDIVCNNVDYWSTSAGTKYRTCINCLQNSTAVNGSETDVGWYLYNIRYAVDVCLYSYPSTGSANSSVSSPCSLDSNCKPLKTALESGKLSTENATEYQYCSADNGSFSGSTLDGCIQCLQADTPQTYLSNFLTALSAGCKQQPPTGDLLGLNSTLFSASAVSIITPSWNQTEVGAATPVTAISTGTVVGIAVGAGLLVFGAIALFYAYWRKQRRAKMVNPFSEDPLQPKTFRSVESVTSSTSGGYIPFYTTDYKKPADDQRNFELYEKIATQHLVIPARKQYETGAPETASLWGRDTPFLTRQHFITGKQPYQNGNGHGNASTESQANIHNRSDSRNSSNTNNTNNTNSSTTNLYSMGQGLDEMPTHPAFMPRAFTRPSRNPIAPNPDVSVKSNKPDEYAVQRYLANVEHAPLVDVASLVSPPLPTTNTRKTASPEPNPFASPQSTPKSILMNIPKPPPGLPPNSVPLLEVPSVSNLRGQKRRVPPPIDISKSKPKAKRLSGSGSDESE